MKMVTFGKVWKINTREDYDNAMAALDKANFYAEMSDDFRAWQDEKKEIARQMAEIKRQAAENGIL